MNTWTCKYMQWIHELVTGSINILKASCMLIWLICISPIFPLSSKKTRTITHLKMSCDGDCTPLPDTTMSGAWSEIGRSNHPSRLWLSHRRTEPLLGRPGKLGLPNLGDQASKGLQGLGVIGLLDAWTPLKRRTLRISSYIWRDDPGTHCSGKRGQSEKR